MHLERLPQRIRGYIRDLTADSDFQRLYRTDTVLDEIEAKGEDTGVDLGEYSLLTSEPITDDPILTVKALGYLEILKSPLIRGDKAITAPDIDLAYYLISGGDIKGALTASEGFCRGIGYDQAYRQLIQAVKIAFRPLSLYKVMRWQILRQNGLSARHG